MEWRRVVGGTLLVSGTTIGAAMLALPVSTAQIGYWPALLLFLLVWFFMNYTAFLTLEANTFLEGEINLISMARRTLGPIGEAFSWVVYLLLLYSLVAAYLSGSGALLLEALHEGGEMALPTWVAPIPFAVGFSCLIYFGMQSVDWLNRGLMALLFLCFVFVFFAILPEVELVRLSRVEMSSFWAPTFVVITSFGFHIIVPSLTSYLGRDLAKIKTCLWVGGLLPLVVYLIWQFVILGALPLAGTLGLQEILESGQPAASLSLALRKMTGLLLLPIVMDCLSFLTIVTSLLGVSYSLSDFLHDGLRIKPTPHGRMLILLLTFLPPLFLASLYPTGFITMLKYAGLFVVLLLGLLPIAMVFSERYIKKRGHEYRAFGGIPLLLLSAIFFIGMLVLFIFQKSEAVS